MATIKNTFCPGYEGSFMAIHHPMACAWLCIAPIRHITTTKKLFNNFIRYTHTWKDTILMTYGKLYVIASKCRR